MSRTPALTPKGDDCFPRVSGDEPEYQELGTLLGAFSPRERG